MSQDIAEEVINTLVDSNRVFGVEVLMSPQKYCMQPVIESLCFVEVALWYS